MDNHFFDNCPHRQYSKGYKIPVGSSNYPTSAYGHYLPGDEPGYYCDLDETCCDEGKFKKINECCRMIKQNIFCPECLKEDSKIEMYKDLDDNFLYCPECDFFKKV